MITRDRGAVVSESLQIGKQLLCFVQQSQACRPAADAARMARGRRIHLKIGGRERQSTDWATSEAVVARAKVAPKARALLGRDGETRKPLIARTFKVKL